MKLLKCGDCHLPLHGGNVKEMTVMEEVLMEELSDAGSIPARSIRLLCKPKSIEPASWSAIICIPARSIEKHKKIM